MLSRSTWTWVGAATATVAFVMLSGKPKSSSAAPVLPDGGFPTPPSPTPAPSPAGAPDVDVALGLIKKWEGFVPNAYADPADPTNGPVTIGYGTTLYPDGTRPQIGDVVTEQQALDMARWFVENSIKPALEQIPVWDSMNVYQRGALISFAYNLGHHFYGAKNFSSITKALDSSTWTDDVPDAMRLYVYAGGQKFQGLVNRREAEIEVWYTA